MFKLDFIRIETNVSDSPTRRHDDIISLQLTLTELTVLFLCDEHRGFELKTIRADVLRAQEQAVPFITEIRGFGVVFTPVPINNFDESLIAQFPLYPLLTPLREDAAKVAFKQSTSILEVLFGVGFGGCDAVKHLVEDA